uniref:CC domain-containing protein n=1 Tax=Steinernema glaseri TaxID=37863 RepID=A0A1I7YEA2_9BILA
MTPVAMWSAVLLQIAFFALSKAQSCAPNEIYTNSCDYCEETCWPWTVKCGTEMNPGCSSGQSKCICPAGYGVARDACGGCSSRTICPRGEDVGVGTENSAMLTSILLVCGNNSICPPDDSCFVQQICIRASPLNYENCVSTATQPTAPPAGTTGPTSPMPSTTFNDPCANLDCPCGTLCIFAPDGPKCVDFGACALGMSNCTGGQLCNDTGLSFGTPPDCTYEWSCTVLPTTTTLPPPPPTTHFCPHKERFFITFLHDRSGQCLPAHTKENPCKYLRCKNGYHCVSAPVQGCSCCGQNARCVPNTQTHGKPTKPMKKTTTPRPRFLAHD